MKQSNAIIITIILSVVLGACGFFGVRYFLTRDTADNLESGVVTEGSGGGLLGGTGSLPGQTGGDTSAQDTSSSDVSPPQGGGTGNQQTSGQPPADYPHPVIVSVNAVMRNADDGSSDCNIDFSITFLNNSPFVLTHVSGIFYALDSDYDISQFSGKFGGDWSDLPNPVQPGETVTFTSLFVLESWSSTLGYFDANNVRAGIIFYECEDGSFKSVTGSFSAYADVSEIYMVPVVISDQR